MISVIMPVYNAEKYLECALKSVLGQSYTDWELIIIDDGSVDNSLQICKTYEESDSRIHLISKENAGVSSARNRGLESVQGEWIYFMDADDRIEKNSFKVITNYLWLEDVDVICWNYMREYGNGIKKAPAIFPHVFIEEEPYSLIKEIVFPGYAVKDHYRSKGPMRTLWSKLFHKSIITEDIRFNEEIKIGEDALFCSMCFKKARRVMFINEYLYYYREVTNSADQRYREDIEEVFEQLIKNTYYFLKSDFGNIEINTCFAGLICDCVARALEKKFVNVKNPVEISERILQIKKFIESKCMVQVFAKQLDWSVFNTKHKLVILCMKWKLYGGLYMLQKMKEVAKKIKR